MAQHVYASRLRRLTDTPNHFTALGPQKTRRQVAADIVAVSHVVFPVVDSCFVGFGLAQFLKVSHGVLGVLIGVVVVQGIG